MTANLRGEYVRCDLRDYGCAARCYWRRVGVGVLNGAAFMARIGLGIVPLAGPMVGALASALWLPKITVTVTHLPGCTVVSHRGKIIRVIKNDCP